MGFPLFEANVTELCRKLRRKNPVSERTVKIYLLRFWINNQPVSIRATDMNRVGRLFFQELVPKDKRHNNSEQSFIICNVLYQARLTAFFADKMEDAEAHPGRYALLDAARNADRLEIFWKEPSLRTR